MCDDQDWSDYEKWLGKKLEPGSVPLYIRMQDQARDSYVLPPNTTPMERKVIRILRRLDRGMKLDECVWLEDTRNTMSFQERRDLLAAVLTAMAKRYDDDAEYHLPEG